MNHMAYVNYARKPSVVKVSTRDIDSVPWERFYDVYTAAANDWEELALITHENEAKAGYEYMLRSKELAYSSAHPEEGSYEGSFRDEYPMNPLGPLPNRASGRRKAGQKALGEAIKALNYGDWSVGILPQIITRLGNLPIDKDDKGFISGKAFVLNNFKTPAERGMYLFLMLDSRSSFLSVQYKLPAKTYCSLVPYILYAQRLVKGIPYTAWGREELHFVVHKELADAMLFETDEWPTTQELLDGRLICLTQATGKDAGKLRSALYTHKLYATTGTCYQGMPPLAQVMLAQIWGAHPDNRTKYMVLDPRNWEGVPPALISSTVVALSNDPHTADVPW